MSGGNVGEHCWIYFIFTFSFCFVFICYEFMLCGRANILLPKHHIQKSDSPIEYFVLIVFMVLICLALVIQNGKIRTAFFLMSLYPLIRLLINFITQEKSVGSRQNMVYLDTVNIADITQKLQLAYDKRCEEVQKELLRLNKAEQIKYQQQLLALQKQYKAELVMAAKSFSGERDAYELIQKQLLEYDEQLKLLHKQINNSI